MEKYKVFIDGSAGTTGLRIADRLSGAAFADKIELLTISEADRKDVAARAAVINSADLAFLCLPDAASKEVVPLLRPDVKVLDTSTAFRTDIAWTYGFPELKGQRAAVQTATRIAVPGCHASGFIALVRPLVELGLLPSGYPLSCHSVTGYSGGGKAMIADYQSDARPTGYNAPRAYGLTLAHKHLPEMMDVCGIDFAPIFCPIVADYYSGMQVTVPLQMGLLSAMSGSEAPITPAQLADALAEYYQEEAQITVHPLGETPSDNMISSMHLSGSDKMELFIATSPDGSGALLIALFDNLGKGSSGAAVQCMNIALGLAETLGLE